jgi:SAP domain-containing protein
MGVMDQPLDDEMREYLENSHPRGREIIAANEEKFSNSSDDEEVPDTAQPGKSDSDEDDVPEYSEWKVEDLRAELKARDLSSAGTKADLIARLEADDAEESE